MSPLQSGEFQDGHAQEGTDSETLPQNDVLQVKNNGNAYVNANTNANDNVEIAIEAWAYLPLPTLPPKEQFKPIEKFVSDAISSRHSQQQMISQQQQQQQQQQGQQQEKKNPPSIAGYRAVLDLLRKRDDLEMLRKVFLAFRTIGIEKMCSERSKHNRLIHYIFILNPFDPLNNNNANGVAKDCTLGEAYLNFIVALTSANSVFLVPTLNALWRLIISTDAVTPNDNHDDDIDTSDDDSDDENEDDNENHQEQQKKKDKQGQGQGQDRNNIHAQKHKQRQLKTNSLLHGTLRKVLTLIPKGQSEIFPVIASSFPFKLSPLEDQVNYMKQCLIVLQYVPNMLKSFLELCIDKCLEIDVEIKIDDNGKAKIEQGEGGKENDKNLDIDMNGGGNDIATTANTTPSTTSTSTTANKKIEGEKGKEKENDTSIPTELSDKQRLDEMADKLDTLMYLVFDHLTKVTVTTTNSKQKLKTARQVFKMLMPSFESVILTTHRCKFVQFIVMYLCGLDSIRIENEEQGQGQIDTAAEGTVSTTNDGPLEQPQAFREFAAKLIDIVLDPYRATVTRQSAACYLASFVSRTACVCPETACEAVSALLRFAKAYMDAFPTEASARNARRYLGTDSNGEQADRVSIHALFYTICQASFYIMCFRGKECIEYHKKAIAYYKDLDQQHDHDDIDKDMMLEYSDPQLIDITAETWDRVCTHHLNPLKFCLESVRGEFLHLADNFDLLKQDVLDKLIIEDGKMASLAASSVASATSPNEKKKMMRKKKKRRRASCIQTAATLQKRRLVGGVGGLGKGSNPLDSFFPFDPYLLRRSYVFVHSYYRQWDSSSIVNDKKDDEEVVKEVDEVDVHDNDYYDITSIDDSQSDGFEEEEEEITDSLNDDENYDKHGSTAMSLMSTTASMGGSEWTDDLSDTELDGIDNCNHRNGRVSLVPAVNELKRARSLSMADDCW